MTEIYKIGAWSEEKMIFSSHLILAARVNEIILILGNSEQRERNIIHNYA